MLHDWQRGKIPYFVAPPFEDEEDESSKTPAKKKKRTEEPENAEAPSGPQLGTILQDIPQNFTKIAVKQQFNEEDNVVPDYMEESELDQTTGKKNATDWDDVLGGVQGDDDEDLDDMDDVSEDAGEDDDELYDQMISDAVDNAPAPVPAGKEIDIEDELNKEFASDSEDEVSTPAPKKLIVVNKDRHQKRRFRGKKGRKKGGADDFEIVKEPRMKTNKQKIGTHF